MPIYEYRCGECNLVSEHILGRDETPIANCLGCDASPSKLEKVMSKSNIGTSKRSKEDGSVDTYCINLENGELIPVRVRPKGRIQSPFGIVKTTYHAKDLRNGEPLQEVFSMGPNKDSLN